MFGAFWLAVTFCARMRCLRGRVSRVRAVEQWKSVFRVGFVMRGQRENASAGRASVSRLAESIGHRHHPEFAREGREEARALVND